MKVKDQLKVRREQLGITVNSLAKQLDVSAQAVRHWENGRSFPGKSKTAALEAALSFTIDWTEGARAAGQRPQVGSLIDPNDVALLLQIGRLPPPAKALISSLVDMCLGAVDGAVGAISERVKESPARPFYDAKPSQHEEVASVKQSTTAARTKKAQVRGGSDRPASRRKAA